MKSKKQEKNFKDILMVTVAAVILVFSLAILINMPIKTSSTNDMALMINNKYKEDVVSIDISNPYDNYTVESNRASCSIKELQNITTDSNKFNSLLLSSSQIKASQLVAEETYSFQEYGLDIPSTVVKITYKDQSQTTLNIGNEAPLSAGIYVNVADTSRVYLFSKDFIEPFYYNKLDYVSKDIIPRLSSSGDSINVSKVTLKGAERPEDLVISVGTDTGNTTNYQVKTANITSDGDKTKSMAIINEIKNLSAESIYMINPTKEDLKNCGLSTSYATAVISSDDGPCTVSVSAPDSQGYVYAVNKSFPVIYKLIASKEDWITVTFDDIVSKNILTDPITSIKSLNIQDSDKNHTFLVEYSQQSDYSSPTISSVKYNGQDINVEYFKNFYQNLISCSVSSFNENKTTQENPSILSYKFAYNDNSRSELTVNFSQNPNDPTTAHVFKNFNCNSTVNMDYINKIKEDLLKLTTNQPILVW